MQILALIPARGGSKSVPRKNIRTLAGRPLLAWTIDAALSCKMCDRVVLSTDDAETASIARSFGAEVPFTRPAELALDDTLDFPVCAHALSWLDANQAYRPDFVVWLRPTSPLRVARDIDEAVELLVSSGADAVRSVCLAEHHPYWMHRIEGDRLIPFVENIDLGKFMRRQQLPPVYRLNGSVDAVTAANVEAGRLFEGDVRAYVMPQERSIDVDSHTDFALAELLIKEQGMKT